MKRNYDKILFDLVDSIGEILEGDIHIIDTTDYPQAAYEKSYRIYHRDGYCFDVVKEVDEEDDDGHITYYYYHYSEWDYFNPFLTAQSMIKILKKK